MMLPWKGIIVDGIRLDRKQQREMLEQARHLVRNHATFRERIHWIMMTVIVYVLCMCIWSLLLFLARAAISTSNAGS